MKFLLIIFCVICCCESCNFTYEEEDGSVNERGIKFNKNDLYRNEYQYSLVPESSIMSISQEGVLNFKRGTDREWLCNVPELSSTCSCKQPICRISVGIWMQERSSIKRKPPNRWQVEICIRDKNDNCPKLPPTIHKSLPESTKIGFRIPLPPAVDLDSPEFSKANYKLKCNRDSSMFALVAHDINNPHLELTSHLDHETITSHTCQLEACEDQCCSTSILTISVIDDNDHSPTWTVASWENSIAENSPPNTHIMQLSASDLDSTYNQLTYSIEGPRQDLFLVEIRSGIIRLAGYLDYETMNEKVILLHVKVTDNGIYEPKSATGTVTISITDINDNRPVINIKNNIIPLDENVSQAYLGYMTVTDADSGMNGAVTCIIIHPDDKVILKSPKTPSKDVIYDIYTSSSFDHEATPKVSVKISCQDMGQPKLSSEVELILQIKDIDDNNVKFTKKVFAVGIEEEREIGCFITQVEAIDKDSSSILEYFLTNKSDSEIVEIDKNTGTIRSNRVFDREIRDEYKIGVTVREKMFPNKTDSANVLIRVLDINDNDPKFDNLYSFSVSEKEEINFEVGKVLAIDPDLKNNGTVVYSQVKSDENHFIFFVDQTGKIRLFQRLDYESQVLHHLIVVATDLGYPTARTTTTTVIISVLDENDNPPKFKNKIFATSIGCHNRFISREQILVTDNDTETKNRQMFFQLSMVNPATVTKYIRIDNQSGEITMDIDQHNGIACTTLPRLIKMKITVFDPNVPDFKDFCMLKLEVSHPNTKTTSQDQQIPDYKGKPKDKNSNDKDIFPPNPNQFDSSIFLVVILIVFSVILLLLLTCVAVFAKRCKDEEQEQSPKDENEISNQHHFTGKFDKTNFSIKKPIPHQRTEFQMFSHKLPDVETGNSLFSEHIMTKLEDRCSIGDDRNEYQLLGQSHDYRNLNPPPKYFNNYMIPNADSPTNHPLIVSRDNVNTFLTVKPTVSTSFV